MVCCLNSLCHFRFQQWTDTFHKLTAPSSLHSIVVATYPPGVLRFGMGCIWKMSTFDGSNGTVTTGFQFQGLSQSIRIRQSDAHSDHTVYHLGSLKWYQFIWKVSLWTCLRCKASWIWHKCLMSVSKTLSTLIGSFQFCYSNAFTKVGFDIAQD